MRSSEKLMASLFLHHIQQRQYHCMFSSGHNEGVARGSVMCYVVFKWII